MDMKKVFLLWFKWGFYANAALFATMSATVAFIACKIKTQFFFVVTIGVYLTQLVIWLVMGAIWRFSELGMVAAGDTLTQEEGISNKVWRD